MIRETTHTFTTVEKTNGQVQDMIAARSGRFTVAEIAGACAGFITWGAFRAGPGYAGTVEHSIIASQPRTGVGRVLMEAAIEAARGQGTHVMVAGIGGENTGAVQFHTRLGFANAGRLSQVGHKHGRWHDLILMSRIVSTS